MKYIPNIIKSLVFWFLLVSCFIFIPNSVFAQDVDFSKVMVNKIEITDPKQSPTNTENKITAKPGNTIKVTLSIDTTLDAASKAKIIEKLSERDKILSLSGVKFNDVRSKEKELKKDNTTLEFILPDIVLLKDSLKQVINSSSDGILQNLPISISLDSGITLGTEYNGMSKDKVFSLDIIPCPYKVVAVNDSTIQLRKSIIVTVDLMNCWLTKIKGSNTVDPKTLIYLCINNIPIKNLHPTKIDTEKNGLTFSLDYNDKTKDDWNKILGSPSFPSKKVSISVGSDNLGELASNISEIDFNIFSTDRLFFNLLLLIGIIILIITFTITIFLSGKGNTSKADLNLSDLIRDSSKEPETGNRPFSLARTQMLFWFFVILISFAFILTTTDAYPILTTEVFLLLGISSGTVVGAKIIEDSKLSIVLTSYEKNLLLKDFKENIPTNFDTVIQNIRTIKTPSFPTLISPTPQTTAALNSIKFYFNDLNKFIPDDTLLNKQLLLDSLANISAIPVYISSTQEETIRKQFEALNQSLLKVTEFLTYSQKMQSREAIDKYRQLAEQIENIISSDTNKEQLSAFITQIAPSNFEFSNHEKFSIELYNSIKIVREHALYGPASEGFIRDILTDSNGLVSIHRFQMFIWTIILGIGFLVTVYESLTMTVSGNFLGLMGISATVYGGAKLTDRT